MAQLPTNPIWRCSLSLRGRRPARAQWAEIADKLTAEVGIASAPWCAVRRGDDNIHQPVSRVDFAGERLTDRWDYPRAREVADRLEEEHGLVRARDRFRPEGPRVRNNELQAAQRRGAEPPEPRRPAPHHPLSPRCLSRPRP